MVMVGMRVPPIVKAKLMLLGRDWLILAVAKATNALKADLHPDPHPNWGHGHGLHGKVLVIAETCILRSQAHNAPHSKPAHTHIADDPCGGLAASLDCRERTKRPFNRALFFDRHGSFTHHRPARRRHRENVGRLARSDQGVRMNKPGTSAKTRPNARLAASSMQALDENSVNEGFSHVLAMGAAAIGRGSV